MKQKTLLCFIALSINFFGFSQTFTLNDVTYKVIDATNSYVQIGTGDVYASAINNSFSGTLTIPSSINYNNINYTVKGIGSWAFSYCSALTSISMPNSVQNIGSAVFVGCSSLSSLIIPTSVKTIGSGAFSFCSNLTDISIPNSVTRIENQTFSLCSNLKNITIPNSVTFIGEKAFEGCKFSSVTIPNSVTSIGSMAFIDCVELLNITLSNSLKTIGTFAFRSCKSLTSITLPSSLTSVDASAFSGCVKLTSIIVDENNLNFTSLDGILFNKAKTSLLKYPIGIQAENYTIPKTVREIGFSALEECKLTKIIIPDEVTVIGNSSFSYCSALTNINMPESLTSIGEIAFRRCSSLTNITIPKSVKTIGSEAFTDCSGLTKIYANPSIPISLTFSNSVFYYVDKTNCTLSVPKGSKAAYDKAFQWSEFKNIIEEDIANGIEPIHTNNFKFYIVDNQLKFSLMSSNEHVYVANIDGKIIYNKNANTQDLTITLPTKGMYVVRVGNKSIKLIVERVTW